MKRAQLSTLCLLLATPSAMAAQWTDWLDRDNPGGTADSEMVSQLYAQGLSPCNDPIAIEARRISDDVDASETGEVITLSLAGFKCLRADQPDNTCDDYAVRLLCPTAADGTWSDWHDKDDPSGSGDYERSAAKYAVGAIPCDDPIAVQARRVSDQVDASQTGELVRMPVPKGFSCNVNQQDDGECDDYEARYFCLSGDTLSVTDGAIDMGAFTILYGGAEATADGTYLVDSGFEIWFGVEVLQFDGSLEFSMDGDTPVLEAFAIDDLPTSNLPGFDLLRAGLPAGVSISMGYGALPGDMDAGPIDPDGDYLYFEIANGASLGLGDVELSTPGQASALLVIDPNPLTVYGNLAGVFPSAGYLTLNEIGLGFSTTDGLSWTPTVDWDYDDTLVAQTGNSWINANVSVGVSQFAGIGFDGECLADIDYAALVDGDPAVDMLAFNGAVSLELGNDIISLSQTVAQASVLYTADDDRWLAVAESVDLESGVIQNGLAGLVDFEGDVRLAVDVRDEALHAVTVEGQVNVFGDYPLASARLQAYNGVASLTGTLDVGFGTVDLEGIVNMYGFGMLSGSFSTTAVSGFYKVTVSVLLQSSGSHSFRVKLSEWDFIEQQYETIHTFNTSFDGDEWCGTTSGISVCFDDQGKVGVTVDYSDAIAEALAAGWSLVTSAGSDALEVIDAAGDVIDDADHALESLGGAADDAAEWVCGWLGC